MKSENQTPLQTTRLRVMQGWEDGFIEEIEIEPYGTLRCIGWSVGGLPSCFLKSNDRVISTSATFRRRRRDVQLAFSQAGPHSGFSIEFYRLRPEKFTLQIGALTIDIPETLTISLGIFRIEYDQLLDGSRVLHRDEIYGVGIPTDSIHADIFSLASELGSPILDLGCGSGPFIRALRKIGKEAFGVEIDRGPIRDAIKEDVVDYIRLYDGTLPLPYDDGAFESVLCTEVLEHVPNFEALLKEIARMTRSSLVATVPDMSCIPIGTKNAVVPWHLLEASHVNFFNIRSLHLALQPYFREITFYQLGHSSVNGSFMPGSLGVIARK